MCDTLAAVTDDGVIFAKNSDRDPNEAQFLDWVPAALNQPGQTLRCTWIDIPQVERTHAMLLSRPWWIWGAEIGTNEAGVTIGNEAVFTHQSIKRSRSDAPGLIGMDLLRLGLERASSANDALAVIVDLLERFGQHGSCSLVHPGLTYDNSFIIADCNGAMVLETAGREWVTERLGHGEVRSLSNALTIEGFASRHSNRLRSVIGRAGRRSSLSAGTARSLGGPAGAAAALRNHLGPAPLPYSPLTGAMSTPCMHAGGALVSNQTVSSWVSHLGTTNRHWSTATSAPCLSVFKPVSLAEPLGLGPTPSDHFDAETLWWRHELFHRVALADLDKTVTMIRSERDSIESDFFGSTISSPEAFELAERVEQKWLAQLTGTETPDSRPAWLKALWRNLDRAAAIPRHTRVPAR